ncbi:hypothetical protein ACCS92_10710 [Rhizobium ruizarguesonis]
MVDLPTRRDAGRFFWGLMWLILAVGIVAEVLPLVLRWKPPFGWWTTWTLGFGIWAGALGLCALALRLVSHGTDLFRALAAMWRTILLVIVAGYLLFANDQGRELGVGLIDEESLRRFFFLFLALIYWATNNWHTARLGLRTAVLHGDIPAPSADDKWLFWPPRLLGVCAHLFAAINLSLAAASQPESVSGLPQLVAWTAPLLIVVATVLIWILDRLLLSQRRPREKTVWNWIFTGGAAILLLAGIPGFIAIFAINEHLPHPPIGLSLGTFFISASAVVFLICVGWLRRRPPMSGSTEQERAADAKRENRQIFLCTVGLFLVAVVFACATWTNAVAVGRSLGSMVVAYFALGAVLALVNAVEFAVAGLTERGVFGQGAKPRIVGAYAAVFLVAVGLVNAWLHPFHRVRHCDGDCKETVSFRDRPTVAEAAHAWYNQAKAAYDKAHGEGPVPMVIVATAGGGIRAAFWTAEILETLTDDFASVDGFREANGVRPYLFAISGVSGGSVGATAFEAALAERDKHTCRVGDGTCPRSTTFLAADFLAPALASLVFVDAPSSFLPDFGQLDRGTALERSFEDASGGLLNQPFLSLFPYRKNGDKNDPAIDSEALWRPILLLNATHEETGRRIITSPVLIERNVFIDSYDALDVLQSDVRASTAAHNSARFSYISPAGDLGKDSEGMNYGSVIDGGYFENYGALTALELANAARSELNEKTQEVKLVVLMISSDPGLKKTHELVRIKKVKDKPCLVSVTERDDTMSGDDSQQTSETSANYLKVDPTGFENAWLNEFQAPLQGIKNVREAHGNRAAAALALEVCAEYPRPSSPPSSVNGQQARFPPDASRSSQAQNAILGQAKDASISYSAPVAASNDNPYFAHLAMCTDKGVVQPPLGWVLSSATRQAFVSLLGQCGNDVERRQLEIAIGGRAAQTSGDRKPDAKK